MNLAKRILVVTVALAFSVAVFSIVSPRSAQAIIATLVRDVDNPSNEPFEWEAIGRPNAAGQIFGSFTVPSTTADGRTVQRLVIEHICILCEALAQPTVGARLASTGCLSAAGACIPAVPGGNPEFFFNFPVSPEAGKLALSQPIRLYADPGAFVEMNLLDFESSGVCSFSASGHFVVQ